jgi:hypothetical protein
VRPVPRRVLLQGPREAPRLSLGEGSQDRADHRVLRRDRLPRLDAQGHRRARAQGAASRVRDVEPGFARTRRGHLRRLPHAVDLPVVHRSTGCAAPC